MKPTYPADRQASHQNSHQNSHVEQTFELKATIMLIAVFAFLQVYSIQSILPVLMQQFNASEVQVGMAVGATVFAVAIMSPFFGMLSDAIGRKNIIVASLLFLAIPTGLIAISPTIDSVILWRFLQGLSVPGITVVTIAYISEEFRGSATSNLMAYYVSGCVLGGFLGRFILGHLEELMGWRPAYWVMAALTLAGAIWVALTLPASKNFVANPNVRSNITMLASHLTNRYVVSASLLGFCVLFSLVGCFTFISLHLAAPPYSLSVAQLANIFVVYLLGVIVTPLSAKLIPRFGGATSITAAIIVSMLGVSLTLMSPFWVIILGVALMSTGVFVTQSATISYIAMNVQQGRSLASGLYYMAYYSGGTLGAWVCGFAYARGQWSLTVGLLLAVQVLALLITAFGLRRSAPT